MPQGKLVADAPKVPIGVQHDLGGLARLGRPPAGLLVAVQGFNPKDLNKVSDPGRTKRIENTLLAAASQPNEAVVLLGLGIVVGEEVRRGSEPHGRLALQPTADDERPQLLREDAAVA